MTVPQAVTTAKQYLLNLVPELQDADVQLEELDVSPSSARWKITFSAMPMLPSESSWGKIMRATRVSKAVEIDSLNGDLISMKNVPL